MPKRNYRKMYDDEKAAREKAYRREKLRSRKQAQQQIDDALLDWEARKR